jgi:hypothetical protein
VKNRKRKETTRMATLTSDVSPLLRAINSTNLWKNSSTKFNRTITNTKHATKNTKKIAMTEDDIDKLFNRSKEKNKNDTQPQDIWGQYYPSRDFASVKFLKVDEPNDKLLNGLPK